MKKLTIALIFAASCLAGFGQGVILGPGQSYSFEFGSLSYGGPATLSDCGSVSAYFGPGTFSDGESVEFAVYANSLADTPLIDTYTHSGPADPLCSVAVSQVWLNTAPPHFPDCQGVLRVTMVAGDAEFVGFGVKQVIDGGVYSGFFPVPEPSIPALLGLGFACLVWSRIRTRSTHLGLPRTAR